MAERNELTARELAVVEFVSLARGNPYISAQLGVSEGTVKRHLANVMIKWNASNRTEVAVQAILRGVVRSAHLQRGPEEAVVCPLCGQSVPVDPPRQDESPQECEPLPC